MIRMHPTLLGLTPRDVRWAQNPANAWRFLQSLWLPDTLLGTPLWKI